MSENRQLSYNGHDESDEDSDIPTTKHFNHGDDENDEESSTKQRQNGDINEFAKPTIKRPKVTNHRPPNVIAEGGLDVKQGMYFKTYIPGFEDKLGRWMPNAGHTAEDGVGQACPENPIIKAEVKGPSSSSGVKVSAVGVEAMARAEVASASVKAGQVGVKVGLGFDTGACVGEDGVEAKFLGTGFTIGQKTSISVLGSEASCSVM
uniref:Uncharacterized protein n=1 Tax=Cyprinus carpio TaxID=7962 RepID=A0A8C1K4V8_CYPCA